MNTQLPGIRALALACMTAAAPACLADTAGSIHFVKGEAFVLRAAGGQRAAFQGLQLDEGDTVVTGRGASVQLRMADQGLIAVRPDSQLKIDTYRYSGAEDGTERGVLSLVKGGFRTLTGIIGRTNKRNYQVNTPTATIGIRGTDHEVVHIPVPSPGETPLGTPGTYNKVNVGETFIQTRGGRIELSSNQVGFAGLPGTVPVKLDAVPPFMRATPQQLGRDDRRQPREAAQGDQRRIAAQQAQQGQEGQPGRPGQPGQQGQQGREGQAGQQGQPGAQGQPGQPGLAGQQVQPMQPGQPGQFGTAFGMAGPAQLGPASGQGGPAQINQPVLQQNTTNGAVSFAGNSSALTPAPLGNALVGGDNSSGVLGSGSLVVTASGSSILSGSDGQPAVIADVAGFRYSRSGAPIVDSGGALLNDGGTTVGVKWGVYAGGAIIDNAGARSANFFHFMSAQTTPLAVANNLTGTYGTVFGQTKLITEGGRLGGTVTSANISVNAGQLTAYNIGVTDGLARNWSANCPSCANGVGLSVFANKGIVLAGTSAAGGVSGKAQGFPIGPTGAGLISSFDLKTTSGLGVTGSFAAK